MHRPAVGVKVLIHNVASIVVVGGALSGLHHHGAVFAEHHHLTVVQLMEGCAMGVVADEIEQHIFVLGLLIFR